MTMDPEEIFSKLRDYTSYLEKEVEMQAKKAELEKRYGSSGYSMEMHAKSRIQENLKKFYELFPEMKTNNPK